MKNYIINFNKLVNHLKIKTTNFTDYSKLKSWYSNGCSNNNQNFDESN